MLVNGITWVFTNFSLALFILAVFFVFIQMVWHGNQVAFSESMYRWVTLLPLGVAGLYGFIMHAFFSNFTAATIGWQNSPFQFEVAVANLGFGLVALLAYRATYGFRLANVIGITCWLWGDAVGHIYQIITQHNLAIGNAGSWFWMDIILPLILIICIVRVVD